jgi:hypothetical protein
LVAVQILQLVDRPTRRAQVMRELISRASQRWRDTAYDQRFPKPLVARSASGLPLWMLGTNTVPSRARNLRCEMPRTAAQTAAIRCGALPHRARAHRASSSAAAVSSGPRPLHQRDGHAFTDEFFDAVAQVTRTDSRAWSLDYSLLVIVRSALTTRGSEARRARLPKLEPRTRHSSAPRLLGEDNAENRATTLWVANW